METNTCPVCKTVMLEGALLERGLRAARCGMCVGVWIAAGDYQEWRRQGGTEQGGGEDEGAAIEAQDVNVAKICPFDGHILLRYKIGRGISFSLDRCNTCNGVWLDPNEWDVLKRHGLHAELSSIFTDVWQRRVRQEERRRAIEAIYVDKLGVEDYAEIRRVRAWIQGHPQRLALLAYLTDEDPYSM
jgi:Zn-finger nucleic acid-binding protein